MIGFCKLHYFENPDYINGKIDKVDMMAYNVRKDEYLCGAEGRNFEERKVETEEEETFSIREYLGEKINKIWRYFSRYDTELF